MSIDMKDTRITETLECLFIHGPTWDGDLPSKSGRDSLVSTGHVERAYGYQWLTRKGIDVCFDLGFDKKKAKRVLQAH